MAFKLLIRTGSFDTPNALIRFLVISVLLLLVATGLPNVAQAGKEDNEPGVTDTFGKKNRRVSSGNIHVRAVNAAVTKDFRKAFDLARQSKSALTTKTVTWLYLRAEPKKAGYARLMAFVKANPSWPRVKLLQRYAERRLLWDQAGLKLLQAHFAANKPVSATGYAALARKYLLEGNKAAARRALLKAWYEPGLAVNSRNAILGQMRALLTRADHERRLWLAIHAQKSTEAAVTARLISSVHVKAAHAAQALIRRRKNALSLYNRLPASMRGKLAMRYVLARYYRKKGQPAKAHAILISVSAKTSGTYDQAAWWVERRLNIREMAGPAYRSKWPSLYRLARRHGFSRGKHFEEGEFLSGWLALRKLGKPKTAIHHFRLMLSGAKSRTQQSRAAYWLARAYLAVGDRKHADKYLKRAARTPTLFYAQLAREALGLGRKPIPISVGRHNKTDIDRLSKHELIRAVRLLHRSGADREVGAFIWPIARIVKNRREASAAADILHGNGGPHLALRLAKAVGAFGIDIDNWGYPVRAMPPIKRIGKPVETAVIFALARQESEFNATAKSWVGARGLMQLMPGTARGLARRYKLRHSTAKLTAHPEYNVMLGTALLGNLIASFDGSYILTFVGYNAGPGRSRQWVRRYGDPRGGKTDPIDWIESIPYTETRKYVQKVMQNVHIYRSRINSKNMTAMSRDLQRGRVPRVTATGVHTPEKNCGSRKSSLTALIQDCN